MSLPDRPGPDVDAEEWSLHHRLFYRLIVGAPGSRTGDLQLLYDAVAPVAYRGTMTSKCDSRRWRRKLLNDLEDAGVVTSTRTPRGWLWQPTVDAVDEPLLARAADTVGVEQ